MKLLIELRQTARASKDFATRMRSATGSQRSA